jgi:lipoprotein-anchoring transpeptidase ErfK/SrfK
MISRRNVLSGIASIGALGLSGLATKPVLAHHTGKKKGFKVDPKYLPQDVSYPNRYGSGTIVVDANSRFLYLVKNRFQARRYGVGVGRAALAWSGTAKIKRKAEWPSWTPTANMIKREPAKYAKYAKGVPGGPNNPLGARALYLYKGNRDTYYRIHGTTQPWSIGTASSNGCIRMVNEHVIDLYERTRIGTTVVVLQT